MPGSRPSARPARRPWARTGTGLRLTVRLTPRGSREAIEGVREVAPGRLAVLVRVTAPPVGGAANEALVRLLAGALGIPRAAVTLVAGESGRLKRIDIAGEPGALERNLERLLAAAP